MEYIGLTTQEVKEKIKDKYYAERVLIMFYQNSLASKIMTGKVMRPEREKLN